MGIPDSDLIRVLVKLLMDKGLISNQDLQKMYQELRSSQSRFLNDLKSKFQFSRVFTRDELELIKQYLQSKIEHLEQLYDKRPSWGLGKSISMLKAFLKRLDGAWCRACWEELDEYLRETEPSSPHIKEKLKRMLSDPELPEIKTEKPWPECICYLSDYEAIQKLKQHGIL